MSIQVQQEDQEVQQESRKLTTEEVAQRYRTVASTVRYWRYIGTGPRGVKYGRKVLYEESELLRWDQEKAAKEYGGAA